jgi:hypothetical protein
MSGKNVGNYRSKMAATAKLEELQVAKCGPDVGSILWHQTITVLVEMRRRIGAVCISFGSSCV